MIDPELFKQYYVIKISSGKSLHRQYCSLDVPVRLVPTILQDLVSRTSSLCLTITLTDCLGTMFRFV